MCNSGTTPLKTGSGKSAVKGKLFMLAMTYQLPIG
jgi:hypothetical protein